MEHLVKQKQYHLLNSDDTRGFEGRCSHVVYRHCIYNIFFTHILTSIRKKNCMSHLLTMIFQKFILLLKVLHQF